MTEMQSPEPQSLPSPQPAPIGSQPSKPHQSQKTRWILFTVGFVGFFLINGIGLAILNFVPNYLNGPLEFLNPLVNLTGFFCLILDLVLIVVLSIISKTRWIVFGFLAAMGVSFLITLLLGIFVIVACFMSPNLY